MSVITGEQVGIRRSGFHVTVSNDPRARLMYYLKCDCRCLDIHDPEIVDFTDHTRFYNLRFEEVQQLIQICFIFHPDSHDHKVFFFSKELCPDGINEFFFLLFHKLTIR